MCAYVSQTLVLRCMTSAGAFSTFLRPAGRVYIIARMSRAEQHRYYSSPRSRTVTLVLALLGFSFVCGLHRLYAGKWVTFILQLITVGGLFIWQIIDIVRIISGSFEDAQGRDITEW